MTVSRWGAWALVAVVLILTGVVAYAGIRGAHWMPGTHQVTGTEHDRVYQIEAMEAFDVQDEKKLVGFADNVFVGRVVGKTGAKPFVASAPDGTDPPTGDSTMIPRTQFAVQVLDNVKGDLKGTVTVSQEGGYLPGREDALALVEDDSLLEAGQTVLFATRFDEGKGWHQITTANYGDVRVRGPEERERLVREFETARDKQVDPMANRKDA